ncbi:MAG: ribose 5-phosphate isomerase B [Ferrovibrio sp.]|uniref:ribose 5-phosphate isomerase B n=1 Tax=Ferrovibrio sp. TaxID=1917215 RepID=UPI00262380FC|nr:ribose 5-phosphate isomerase B [Ferrovibrio sp.]MCW0232705.1 ribose 5-phosphate isomerase B [Ferrovibrio sp.]
MSKPTVALAADHAGFELKNLLRDELKAQGYDVLDLGTNSSDSVDYPDFGRKLAETVAAGKAACGVAVCGTGIGISIAANRIPGCRAALVHDITSARLCREHNDANVLALGARLIGVETARDCLKAFLDTPFAGGRHTGRVAKLGQPA